MYRMCCVRCRSTRLRCAATEIANTIQLIFFSWMATRSTTAIHLKVDISVTVSNKVFH